MLIVMGPVLGVSVADLYAAAIGPGFLLAGMYVVYLLVRSFLNPKLGPPVPKEERVHSRCASLLREVVIGVVPLFGLIARDARLDPRRPRHADRGGGHRRARRADPRRRLPQAHATPACKRALLQRHATSSMVLLLAVTSNIFGAVFARLGAADWITETLLALPLPPTLMLIVVIVAHLPARLAVRVAGGDPGVPADLLPGGGGLPTLAGIVDM